MTSQILLRPDQVPIGALVYICAPGAEMPETNNEDVLLPPLRLLLGGVPLREKWCAIDPANGGFRSGPFEYDAIRDGTRFMPVEAFSADDAPVRKLYAAFVDSERLTYDGYPGEPVQLAKSTDGRIISINSRAGRYRLRRFTVPKGAVLVPTGDFALDKDFDLLGCSGIPKPNAEQRTTLEQLGVVFYDHAPYARLPSWICMMRISFCFDDYVAVTLPAGWTVRESRAWYFDCPYHLEIRDANERPIARIHQEPRKHTHDAVWTGTIELV